MSTRGGFTCTKYKEVIPYHYDNTPSGCWKCGYGPLYRNNNDIMCCTTCDLERLPKEREDIQHRWLTKQEIKCFNGHDIQLTVNNKFECK